VALILYVLCRRGFIPVGKYAIDTRPETLVIGQWQVLMQRTETPRGAMDSLVPIP
jgi:hypothetical protein